MNSSAAAIASRLRHALRWHRRLLAAVAAGVAVLATLTALSPDPPPTVRVVVAAHDLPPGAVLAPDDLRVLDYPATLAPAGAFTSPDQVLGRVLATGASASSALDPTDLVGAQRARAGRMLVPFRVQDPGVVRLLRVGDLITVVGVADTGESTVLARRVRVAALPAADDGTLVVVDVDEKTGVSLGAWGSSPTLSVTLG